MSYGLIETQCIWNISKILILSVQTSDFQVLLTCFCLHYSIVVLGWPHLVGLSFVKPTHNTFFSENYHFQSHIVNYH